MIYIGIPENIKNFVKWVTRYYRVNELSHIPGGSDVIIEYTNGMILGYDWIKNPSNYVESIIYYHILKGFEKYSIIQKIEIIKDNIIAIYARKYKKENHNSVEFEKAWDQQSNILPWKMLKKYDSTIYKESPLIEIPFPNLVPDYVKYL